MIAIIYNPQGQEIIRVNGATAIQTPYADIAPTTTITANGKTVATIPKKCLVILIKEEELKTA